LHQHDPGRNAALRFLERLRIHRHELLVVRVRSFDLLDDFAEFTLRRCNHLLEAFNLGLVAFRFRLGLFGLQLSVRRLQLCLQAAGAIEKSLDRFVAAFHAGKAKRILQLLRLGAVQVIEGFIRSLQLDQCANDPLIRPVVSFHIGEGALGRCGGAHTLH
jgi:hypothetical protein